MSLNMALRRKGMCYSLCSLQVESTDRASVGEVCQKTFHAKVL